MLGVNNPSEFCRFCGRNDKKLKSLFDDKVFLEKYKLAVPLPLINDDLLPQRICSACKLTVECFHDNIVRCKDLNKRWIDSIKNRDERSFFSGLFDSFEERRSQLGVFVETQILLKKTPANPVKSPVEDPKVPKLKIVIPSPTEDKLGKEKKRGKKRSTEGSTSASPTSSEPVSNPPKKKRKRKLDEIMLAAANLPANGQLAPRPKQKPINFGDESSDDDSVKKVIRNLTAAEIAESRVIEESLMAARNMKQKTPELQPELAEKKEEEVESIAPIIKGPLKCQHCINIFPDMEALAEHQLRHMQLKMWNLSSSPILGQKLRRMCMKGNKTCTNCHYVFPDEARAQEFVAHWDNMECNYFCKLCGESFNKKPSLLKLHYEQKHGVKQSCYKFSNLLEDAKMILGDVESEEKENSVQPPPLLENVKQKPGRKSREDMNELEEKEKQKKKEIEKEMVISNKEDKEKEKANGGNEVAGPSKNVQIVHKGNIKDSTGKIRKKPGRKSREEMRELERKEKEKVKVSDNKEERKENEKQREEKEKANGGNGVASSSKNVKVVHRGNIQDFFRKFTSMATNKKDTETGGESSKIVNDNERKMETGKEKEDEKEQEKQREVQMEPVLKISNVTSIPQQIFSTIEDQQEEESVQEQPQNEPEILIKPIPSLIQPEKQVEKAPPMVAIPANLESLQTPRMNGFTQNPQKPTILVTLQQPRPQNLILPISSNLFNIQKPQRRNSVISQNTQAHTIRTPQPYVAPTASRPQQVHQHLANFITARRNSIATSEVTGPQRLSMAPNGPSPSLLNGTTENPQQKELLNCRNSNNPFFPPAPPLQRNPQLIIASQNSQISQLQQQINRSSPVLQQPKVPTPPPVREEPEHLDYNEITDYQCALCAKFFNNEYAYNDHYRLEHAKKKNQQVISKNNNNYSPKPTQPTVLSPPPMCPKPTQPTVLSPPPMCQICETAFSSKEEVRKHIHLVHLSLI